MVGCLVSKDIGTLLKQQQQKYPKQQQEQPALQTYTDTVIRVYDSLYANMVIVKVKKKKKRLKMKSCPGRK